jgi:2-polyprenyl-3-methyl-5-hydroxy-6-metoxy-1,4-benzoquinol methylase
MSSHRVARSPSTTDPPGASRFGSPSHTLRAVSVSERGNHWDGVYDRTPWTDVSWYERDPATSLRLIEEVADGPSAAVVDVGAGASLLVDTLLAHGFTDLTVLDISERALSEVRQRLGKDAQLVTFVEQDVLTWTPDRHYDIWHDRAVFHFLTEPTDRGRYVEIAASAVRSGGSLVLATFAEDGPMQCSGLPVCRYSAEDLAEAFSASFSLTQHEREEHVTPRGVVQPFTWVVLRRT